MKKNDKVKLKFRCDYSKTGGPIIPSGCSGKIIKTYKKKDSWKEQDYWVHFIWDNGKSEYQSTFNSSMLIPDNEIGMAYSIGYFRGDGDFAILATVNNLDGNLDANCLSKMIKSLVSSFSTAFPDSDIRVLKREDAPDYVFIDDSTGV